MIRNPNRPVACSTAAMAFALLCEASAQAAVLPAFPGAAGHGAGAIGGRGGRIIEVINLNDSGPGSLRAAIEATGSRIVVFRVAGIITVQGSIRLRNPYITIAGQTAPGSGITLRGTTDHILRIKDTHDVVIRYLRFRNGSGSPGDNDNINIRGSWNVVIDHVSMSWATDENTGIWRDTVTSPTIHGVTIQRSIFAEGLAGHSKGMQISGYKDYSDPANPVEAWKGISDVTLHHNLYIHNTDRNPRLISSGTQVMNNVVYNWQTRIGESQSASIVDYVGNYYVAGPMSRTDRLLLHENCSPDHPEWVCPLPDPSIYIKGNVVVPVFPDPNADNWNLLKSNFTYAPLPPSFRRLQALPQGTVPVAVQAATDAYASVVGDVGANARLDSAGHLVPNVDSADSRLVADVVNRTGPTSPISSPTAVGGYPAVQPGTPATDSDHDGMPDEFEVLNGFKVNDASDSPLDTDGDGYSNVEEYLNGTAEPCVWGQPGCFWSVSAGPDMTITLPSGATLDGTVSAAGIPDPPPATTTWSKVSGPGSVTFVAPSAVDTTANFSVAGSYVLRMAVSDGTLNASDDVTITVNASGAGAVTMREIRISAGTDDAEQRADSTVSRSSSDLELLYSTDGATPGQQTDGLRFLGVAIPRGAAIQEAWVQFETDEVSSGATTLTIRGQAADNSAAFTSTNGSISSRVRTAAAVSWSPAAWTVVGEQGINQRTTDIKSVIQEIVSRPGWLSGNALVLIVTGTGNRVARAFEGRAAGAALLHVEYTNGP